MPGTKFFLPILMSAILTMSSCTVSKSQKSRKDNHRQKDVKYEEDLSASRLKYQVTEDKPKTDVSTKTKTIVPSKDISKQLGLKMDSISRKNQNLRFAEGYRIQVYSGPSREEANMARDKVLDIIPDVDVYPIFRQPVFRVTVGDYTDRLEANGAFVKLKDYFQNAILVPARINIVRPR
ncbi:MAG TPA: SPOR domain-containing protein [Cytophagaceae bacterium]|nr:SPOR domain-containing protein [Cytophagaceae bacterium]